MVKSWKAFYRQYFCLANDFPVSPQSHPFRTNTWHRGKFIGNRNFCTLFGFFNKENCLSGTGRYTQTTPDAFIFFAEMR